MICANFDDININIFSLFNKQLYDQSNEEFYNDYNSICNNFEEEETNNTESTSNETSNSIDDEEKLIPLNLLDSYKIITSNYKEQNIKKIDDTKNKHISTMEESISKKDEKEEFVANNKSIKKEKEISNIISTEENNEEYSTILSPNIIDKLDINCEPFIPKCKYSQSKITNNQNNNNHHNYFYNDDNNNISFNKKRKQYFNKDKKKNNKKKKKEFVQRKNDWFCYRCKNINFCFREKCNKCHLKKEESEKQYNEAGKKLLQLVNNSDNN